ncbi:hypothetical protein KJ918_07650 [Patescibacteria group bacterium]|nr:hypothetical protein [Patescibacteria group bacterium]
MKKNASWVHFIGICGVTMGPLANMFKELGWFVSGSDKGIFPPMSDYLQERKIKVELGFKEMHLQGKYYTDIGIGKTSPDLVVVGNYVGLSNVEYKFAVKNKLNIKSFPDILEEFLVKSNSIVISGTYGKTTSAALMTLIFQKAKEDPSFMIGGLARNFKDGVKVTRSDWSVVEGDEYISSRFDPVSKFFHYKAEFVLLTAAAWEHTDFFVSESAYVENFSKLVHSLPLNGLLVACRTGKNVNEVLKDARCKVVTYELNKIDENVARADWFNLAHKENKETGDIAIYNRNTKEEFVVRTKLVGDHNKENIIGCCALARELDIEVSAIQEAVEQFEGIKRRLEIRFEEENVKVIDDHACSPPKVSGSINALKDTFPDWHISVIFEPNVGNRTEESMELFDGAFKKADEVIIPRLKTVKTNNQGF